MPQPANHTLDQIFQQMESMQIFRDTFYAMFEANYFLAVLNMSLSEKPQGIYSQNGADYFIYSFWNRPAPAGLAYVLDDSASL